MFFKINNEEHLMNSKIDNKEIIINDKAGEVIKEIFLSLFSICQINLEAQSSKVAVKSLIIFISCKSSFTFCHKLNPNCGVSYIDTSEWIENKKQQ